MLKFGESPYWSSLFLILQKWKVLTIWDNVRKSRVVKGFLVQLRRSLAAQE